MSNQETETYQLGEIKIWTPQDKSGTKQDKYYFTVTSLNTRTARELNSSFFLAFPLSYEPFLHPKSESNVELKCAHNTQIECIYSSFNHLTVHTYTLSTEHMKICEYKIFI